MHLVAFVGVAVVIVVTPGVDMGGDDATLRYAFEGWEVGWITAVGGDELAVGDTIESAVDSALQALE